MGTVLASLSPNGPLSTFAVHGIASSQRGAGRWRAADATAQDGQLGKCRADDTVTAAAQIACAPTFWKGYNMRIYYLDEALADQELEQLRVAVCNPAAETPLDQVRVPCVLPATQGPEDTHDATDRHLYQLAIRHLRRAGLDRDFGHQVGWVLPRDTRWREIFQTAIDRVTGYLPVTIQRWRATDHGTLERAPLCVMDMHGMQTTAASSSHVR